MARGGGCPHPSPGAVTVYSPWGKSEQCSVGGLGGWVGSRGWGEERQLLDTFHLGLANSLAWQKLLENEMWGPVPKMGRGGREDKERNIYGGGF